MSAIKTAMVLARVLGVALKDSVVVKTINQTMDAMVSWVVKMTTNAL